MEVTCGACVKSACIVAGPGPVMLREVHYTFVLGQQRCPMTLFIGLCQVLMIFYHDSLLSKSNTDETDGTDTSTEVRGGGEVVGLGRSMLRLQETFAQNQSLALKQFERCVDSMSSQL